METEFFLQTSTQPVNLGVSTNEHKGLIQELVQGAKICFFQGGGVTPIPLKKKTDTHRFHWSRGGGGAEPL